MTLRKIFQSYPNVLRLVFGAILIITALILSGLVPRLDFWAYFPFAGLILVCLANWIAYRMERKDLSALGFDWQWKNCKFLPLGLLLGLSAFAMGFCMKTLLTGEQLHFNHSASSSDIARQLYWVLPTAAVQEFICRGYCFKKLMEISNVTVANIVMGIVVIAMHDVLGLNITSAITYSVLLFFGHLVHSTALLRAGTIFFPIGIHWGNNLASLFLFTNHKTTTAVLFTTQSALQQSQQDPPLWGLTLYFIVLNIGFILLTLIIWKWPTRKTPAQVSLVKPGSAY